MPEFIKEDEKQYITKGNPDVDPSPVNPGLKNGQESDLTGSGTVLLVEDEDAVRLFGARALRNKGYKVLEAENGEGALDVINGFDKRIDLIISDVVMPGMDGHTLIRLVRHELPDVKVILMSGYAEDVFREEIDRDKSIKFLPKPFSLKTLALTVKATLES
jgi:two-component system cell cycle sensor histidine kinase/response regulator CckA